MLFSHAIDSSTHFLLAMTARRQPSKDGHANIYNPHRCDKQCRFHFPHTTENPIHGCMDQMTYLLLDAADLGRFAGRPPARSGTVQLRLRGLHVRAASSPSWRGGYRKRMKKKTVHIDIVKRKKRRVFRTLLFKFILNFNSISAPSPFAAASRKKVPGTFL